MGEGGSCGSPLPFDAAFGENAEQQSDGCPQDDLNAKGATT